MRDDRQRVEAAARTGRIIVALISAHAVCTHAYALTPDDTYANAMTAAVNDYRAARKLPAISLDPALSRLAAAHSAAMAAAAKMDHDGFPARVRASGFPMCVENVGWNYPSAQAQFDAWRASAGHAANMQRPGIEKMGVGIARGYVTWIACGP